MPLISTRALSTAIVRAAEEGSRRRSTRPIPSRWRSPAASATSRSRSAEVEGRASLLLVPQQRRRHARAAGGGREGLRHRHVARRHARVPEAAGEMGSEQGAERLRRQDARASAVRERARRGRASRQGRLHRSRRRPPSCSSPIRSRTARGQLDQSQSLGSPATYGTIIATWSARTDADRVGHAARQLHDRAGRPVDSRPHAGERARCVGAPSSRWSCRAT